MYVARPGKLYFYKYNYDRDIIVDDDLKYSALFAIALGVIKISMHFK